MSTTNSSSTTKSKRKRGNGNRSAMAKANPSQSKQQSQPRASRRTTTAPNAGLSRPAQEYARAMADPFTGPLATIPDFPSVPSRRFRCFSRGYFYAGSTGFGYVMVDPYRAAAKDANSVFSSDSTYAGTVMSIVAGSGVLTGSTNSDYSISDFGAGQLAQGRIVGAGLRVKYSGTELNRGGVLLGISSPNHQPLNGLTFQDLDSFDCSTRFRPGEKWVTALYCPVRQEELLYSPVLGSSGGLSATPIPILAFAVQAPTAAVGAGFQYEFYAVIEVQGTAIRGVTPSLSDPTGFSAVQTTAQMTMGRAHDMDSSKRADVLVAHTGQVASHTISGWANKAANSALTWVSHNGASVLGNLAMGAMSALF